MELPKIDNKAVSDARDAALEKLDREITILERSGQSPRDEFVKHASEKVSAPFVQVDREGSQPHKIEHIYANAIENVKLILQSQTSDEEPVALNLPRFTPGPAVANKEAQILITAMNEGFRKLGAKVQVPALNLVG